MINQINAAGGVGGSTTMVAVFVVVLCCVLRSPLVTVTHRVVVDKYHLITLR
jgi:hypothetical protein